MKRLQIRFVFSLAVLVFLFPLSLIAQDSAPAPLGLRPDAPSYALHGNYWVGTQAFVIEDAENPIALRVWYPATNPDGLAEATSYEMGFDGWILDGFDNTQTVSIAGHALDNASIDMTGAPYPLVVFSHGFGADGVFYAWFAEHLASYGFVVVAPHHPDEVNAAGSGFAAATIVRPQLISRTLDYAELLTDVSGAMPGSIDMERVAVAGQSYGGYTALAIAGARLDMQAYQERCAGLVPDDPNQFLCVFASSEAEMAELAGLDAIPDGLWPSMMDSRVDIVISIAGDSYMFGEAGLAEISIPVLAIGGTLDTGTPYQWGVRPTYDNISSQSKILASFENGDHFIAATTCADAPGLVDMGFFFLCEDSVWDLNRSHDLINHFSTGFLLDWLKSDADAHAALAPDAVAFPGILYEAEGY